MTSASSDDSIDFSGIDETWFQKTTVGKFLARPCVGSSFAFGTGGYFAAFLSSFGWTSNLGRATNHGLASFGLTAFVSSAICAYLRIREADERDSVETRRTEAKSRRDDALTKTIKERKRRHEERLRSLEETREKGKI